MDNTAIRKEFASNPNDTYVCSVPVIRNPETIAALEEVLHMKRESTAEAYTDVQEMLDACLNDATDHCHEGK